MRTCTFSFADRSGPAQWSLDGDGLTLLPAGGAPFPVSLAEVAGLSGDGYTLDLRLGTTSLLLTKLGADGPTLKEAFNRTWPPLRAAALRLAGTGEPLRFAGHLDGGRGPAPCLLLLYSDLLVAFREGEDARPLFLSLQKDIRHDGGAYTVTLEGWDGESAAFSRMGGATGAFAQALDAARGGLSLQAEDALGAGLPSLGSFPRATLAGTWLPGRLLSIPALESLATDTVAALAVSWMAACPRGREGRLLLEGAQPEQCFFAYTRPGSGVGPDETGAVEESAPEPGEGEVATDAKPAPPLPEGLWPLWLLVHRAGGWFLEALGETDRATYHFSGDDEVPALCSQLLCAPQFSREALYQPVDKLVGVKAAFAIPARDLPFLKELRARFEDRVLHTSLAAWKRGIGS